MQSPVYGWEMDREAGPAAAAEIPFGRTNPPSRSHIGGFGRTNPINERADQTNYGRFAV
jgi:hypothetical protein